MMNASRQLRSLPGGSAASVRMPLNESPAVICMCCSRRRRPRAKVFALKARVSQLHVSHGPRRASALHLGNKDVKIHRQVALTSTLAFTNGIKV